MIGMMVAVPTAVVIVVLLIVLLMGAGAGNEQPGRGLVG